MNWLRVRELVRKEFIQLFRDKKNRPILILSPFIQLLIFGYVVSLDVKEVRVALYDQALTHESRLVIDAFNANRTFRITHYVRHTMELDQLLLQRTVDLAVNIPPDFSSNIKRGHSAPIQILVDGSTSNMAAVRIAYSTSTLSELNQKLIKSLYHSEINFGKVEPRVRTWYNPNLDSRNFFIPGIIAFLIMLLSLLFTSMAIIRERESGTIEQLIVTPLKPGELILGKTIPYIIIAEAQMIMVIVFALIWFSIPFQGSFLLLLLASFLFLLGTLGIGLFISTISSTQQQAMMTTFFFIMPFMMFSGFIFPIANMPAIIQYLAYLNPLKYFLIIIRGVFLKGVGLEILWPQFLALALLGLVVFAGAVARFKKRLD